MLAVGGKSTARRGAVGRWHPARRPPTSTPLPSPPSFRSATLRGVLRAELTGHGGRTHTDLVFCDWSDLILAYAGLASLRRLFSGLAGLGDFDGVHSAIMPGAMTSASR